jgi:transcription elongation GreA/GreB family factor
VRLLERAAAIHAGDDSAVRRAVTEKIRSSVLELREDIPAGYVTLGSRVTFRVNGEVTLSRILVHWDEFMMPGPELSLATPWGIALLGMSAGSEAPVYRRDGLAEMIRVEAIEASSEPQRPRGATERRRAVSGEHARAAAPGRRVTVPMRDRTASPKNEPGPLATA